MLHALTPFAVSSSMAAVVPQVPRPFSSMKWQMSRFAFWHTASSVWRGVPLRRVLKAAFAAR